MNRSPIKLDDALASVTAHYNRGDYKAAIMLGQEIQKKYPESHVVENLLGASFVADKNPQEAIKHYLRAVKIRPNFADGHNNLGVAYLQVNDLASAEKHLEKAIRYNPKSIEALRNLGLVLLRSGRHDKAKYALKKAIKIDPGHVQSLITLGNVFYESGELDKALHHYNSALNISPANVTVLMNISSVHRKLGKVELAEECLQECLRINPAAATVWNNVAGLSVARKKFEEAEEQYLKALDLEPGNHEFLINYARLLMDLKKVEKAKEYFKAAIESRDDYLDAYLGLSKAHFFLGEKSIANELLVEMTARFGARPQINRTKGLFLAEEGFLTDAISEYKSAIALEPKDYSTNNDIGVIYAKLGELKSSEKHLKTAVRIDPRQTDAFSNLAAVYVEIGNYEAAEALLTQISKFGQASAEVLFLHALFHKEKGQINQAIEYYSKVLQKDAHHQNALLGMLDVCLSAYFWGPLKAYETEVARLGIDQYVDNALTPIILEDNPRRQFLRSKTTFERNFRSYVDYPKNLKPSERPERLKIAYVSADFHNFPGMYLMAGMLEHHDRDRFEIFAFSHGPNVDDHMRRRIIKGVDHFIDISQMTDDAAVTLARDLGIDVAMHRNGYTKGHRTSLFAKRLAPLQVNYLGFPNTMGAPFIDYLVADRSVIPPEFRQEYSEKIIYLPHSYQPNDNTRLVPDLKTSRADFGLPDDALVLCCFNKSRKITPQVFNVWKRIMKKVPQAVLWMLCSDTTAMENLRKEVSDSEINPDRLIFAERIDQSAHLARHRHADLFLDTFNYNAHTTASDALWVGLPVVTKQGDQFAARVAAGLLRALEVPELITYSDLEYEELVVRLLQDKELLQDITTKVSQKRMAAPLFDTARYTKALEAGLEEAYAKLLAQKDPEDVFVPDV